MEIEKIIQTIFYIVVIIIIIIIICAIIWSYNNTLTSKKDSKDVPHNNSSSNSPNTPYDDYDDLDTEIKVPDTEYSYDKQKHGLSLNDHPISQESTLSYDEFKSIAFTKTFIQTYYQAVITSLNHKRKLFRRKQRQTNSELRSTQKRVGADGSNNFTHDSNLDRLKRASIEINEIIIAIDRKLATIDSDTIKQDFYDAINDPEFGLESLVGRDDVKDTLALQIFTFARNPMSFTNGFQNMVVYGNSGVGKSKLAETLGFVYSKSNILVRGNVRNVTKQEFTSSYVNESAQLTRELLSSTLEGVLFIDEAYDMCPPSNLQGRTVDHGHEAITELVNFLDKNMGLSIVIAAGYEDDMEDRFMNANQGMPRRFPHKIRLNNYSSKQLTDILLKFIGKSSPEIKLTNVEASYLYTLIDFLLTNSPDIFDKQAGDMLTLSGCITRSVYGSVERRWISGKYTNNAYMLLSGINDYLRTKGLSISAGELDFCQIDDLPTPKNINRVRPKQLSKSSHCMTPDYNFDKASTPSTTGSLSSQNTPFSPFSNYLNGDTPFTTDSNTDVISPSLHNRIRNLGE